MHEPHRSRFQRWCSRLTPFRIRFRLAWNPPWVFLILLGFLLAGILILTNSIFGLANGNQHAPQDLIGGIIITGMSLLAFYAFPAKKKERLEHARFFDYAEEPEMLTERIRSGADHILLETNTLVLTGDYLIRRGDPSSFVPYTAIGAFFLMNGDRKRNDPPALAVCINGRSITIPLKEKSRPRMPAIRRIIEQHAPQAEYGAEAWYRAFTAGT